jgi:hypothetical protein
MREPPRPPTPRAERSTWREQALTRADELANTWHWIMAQTGYPTARIARASIEIEADLEVARQAAAAGRRSWLRRLISSLNPQGDLERALGHLDAAEVGLLRAGPESYARGQVRVLVAKVRRLPVADVRRVVVEELSRRPRGEELTESDRSALLAAVQAANADARRDLNRVRSLRNLVAFGAIVLTVLAAGLALLGAVRPELLPLCFVPGDAVVCPTSTAEVPFGSSLAFQVVRRTAAPPDIAIVELAGLLGAAMAAAVAIRRLPGVSIPYNPVLGLILLKLPAGALSAVLGLLLIRGQFIPGFGDLDSSPQIIAWALLLGYGQQLATRLVDRAVLGNLAAVETPGGSESAELDQPTAEALVRAISSTLRSSAPAAIRDAFEGPDLVNYSGWATLLLLDDTGRPLEPPEGRRVTLVPGQPYTLRVVIGQPERQGLTRVLRVPDGIDEEVVPFAVDVDSNDQRLQRPEQRVTVGAHEGEATVDFPVSIDHAGPRWLWVRVSQRRQILLQFELELVSPVGAG